MKKLNLYFKLNINKISNLAFFNFILLYLFTTNVYSQPYIVPPVIPIQSSVPLRLGQSVVTSYDPLNLQYCVVRIVDIRNRPPFVIGGGINWFPAEYAGVDWKKNKLGNVFGIALDDNANPNMFVARSTVYCSINNDPVIPDNAIIYRLDGANLGVSTYIELRNIPGPPQANVNWIPNTGPGIGNLCYDKWHGQLFFTNHEDGKIYRVKDIAGTGQVKSWYDFNLNDILNPGFAPLGERLWGIGVYGTSGNNVRVYFSRWRFDKARLPGSSTQFNEIWSIALDINGEFIPTSLTKEIEIPYLGGNSLPANYSNPVSDIEFSFKGDMILGERTMSGDMGDCSNAYSKDWAHNSRILEYHRGVNGAYNNPPITHQVGISNYNTSVNNSSGGVDFEYGISDSLTNENALCDSIIVGTGDYQYYLPGRTRVYRLLQVTNRTPGNINNRNFSHYIDITGEYGRDVRTFNGDVDVFRKDLCSINNPDTNCIKIVSDTTFCDSSGTYIYEFKVRNNSPTKTIEQVEITVDSPGLPNYVVTVPSTMNITIPPSGTSGVQRVKMIGPGAVARAEVCYTLSAHFVNDDCPWCCYIENCIKLPVCGTCVNVLNDSMYCSNGSYFYNFELQNGTIYDVTKIQITSPGVNPITFIPQIIHFTTPVISGQVFPVQNVQLLGGAPGMTIPIRIKLFSGSFECCYIDYPYTIPACDTSTLIGINNSEVNLSVYSLEQNYPNPFNPNTYIRFTVPKESNVEISIFDVSGRLVKNLVNNVKYAPGYYSVNFDGSVIPSGMYFYRIKANDFIATRKMLLLK